MGDWLGTPQMSQEEDTAGLAEAVLLGFTLDSNGNSCSSSDSWGQQAALRLQYQSLNSM